MSGNRIEFRILGPLEVWVEDVQLRIGGPRQRALLAFLLLSANRAVSRDRLIDELFGDTRPASADHALRVQVSRLRKALDGVGGERLLASSPGYLLRVEPGEVDLQLFEQLFAEGRRAMEEGEADHAAAKLHAAEKLWRGRPLADLEFEPFARVEVERLEEMRLAAAEARIEAELALGRHAALVPELEALVGEHPLRERLRSQLMLALYRSGRQADALAAYRAGRSLLSDHLALEPSPALRELEQAILRQDPALELGDATKRVSTRVLAAARPPPGPPPSDPVAGRVSPDRRRRHLVAGTLLEGKPGRLLVLGGLVLIAVALLIGFRLSGGGHALAASPNSVGMIDGNRNTLRAVIASGGTPGGIAYGAGAVWIADTPEDLVLRIDPDNRTVDRIPVRHHPTAVAVGDGQVWVVNQLDRTVSEVNPQARRQVGTIPVGNGASAIAYGHGSVWVANATDYSLSRIDPESARVVATIPLAGVPAGIAAGRRGMWVTSSSTGQLLLVDPKENKVSQEISIGNGPHGVAVGGGSVWVANEPDGTVSRLDPRSLSLHKIIVGDAPTGVTYGDDTVWVANSLGGTVSRIDPETGSAQLVEVGNQPTDVTSVGGNAWVTVLPGRASHRGGTLRIALPPSGAPIGFPGSADPTSFGGESQWQLLSLTNDGLVTYRRADGLAGAELVPDLATAIPKPTDGGRTYTFQLLSGIRYSNGDVVHPEDIRQGIRRVLASDNSYLYSQYTGIVGASRCVAKPRDCDLSRGIVSDRSAGTITFHLKGPDPEFLYKLAFAMAAAVPAGTPRGDSSGKPLPATGPYMTKSFEPNKSWVLVRNPYFHEWSREAQPDGYPDRIIAVSDRPSRQVEALERGSTDVLLAPPLGRVDELARRFANQLHIDPVGATFALVMNTRIAPFDKLAVRRALNYALDRNRIARFTGSSLTAQPTCQILAPTIPGYRPYCPYTLGAGPSGSWTAPDLARAEQLVASSGTKGMKVTLLLSPPGPTAPTLEIGHYVVSVLDRLGYRTSTRVIPDNSTPAGAGAFGDSRRHFQIGWFTWYQDQPTPANFVDPLLTCAAFIPRYAYNLNVAEFCDRGIDAEARRAHSLQRDSPAAAGKAWSRVDRELVDRAPWAPLYNPRAVTALSTRVGNYQYHPFWTVLLDQLWVR